MPRPIQGLAIAICLLALASLFVGVSDLSVMRLIAGDWSSREELVFFASRLPRTIALLIAGAGMAVSGVLMQMLARNRFVEPSTTGTTDAAGLGMLCALLVYPDMPVFGKMVFAGVFGLGGMMLFLTILSRVPLRSAVMVPLIGLILGGIISSVTTFIAYRFDLLQSMGAWSNGDFSAVLRGRYELLWVAFALLVLAYLTADRFTVLGLGEAIATNLGLDFRVILYTGLVIVSLVSASVIVTAGSLPFVGLIVPNIVSMVMGDRLRQSLPWIALSGGVLVLACDLLGRLVIAPFEIPVGSVLGVLGSLFFIGMLIGKRQRLG